MESPNPENLEGPTRETINRLQQEHENEAEKQTLDCTDEFWTWKGNIWIPKNETELQRKLLVVVHCGRRVYRAREASLSILRENYYWQNTAEDCDEFI